jgi:hypothetical protein
MISMTAIYYEPRLNITLKICAAVSAAGTINRLVTFLSWLKMTILKHFLCAQRLFSED